MNQSFGRHPLSAVPLSDPRPLATRGAHPTAPHRSPINSHSLRAANSTPDSAILPQSLEARVEPGTSGRAPHE